MSSASTTFSPNLPSPALPAWLAVAVQVCRASWRFWAGEIEPRPAHTVPAASPRSLVRFRHPHTGQAWDGHGPQPQWLRDAVLSQGYTVEELRRAAREAAL